MAGIFFGIVLSKAEVISWYRIYEMFKFQSFHMYGIIGSAVVLGIVVTWFIKKNVIRTYLGEKIVLPYKKKVYKANLLGGICFGLGWALIGACPGPVFILLGRGVISIIVVIIGAVVGAFMYHTVKNKLPH